MNVVDLLINKKITIVFDSLEKLLIEERDDVEDFIIELKQRYRETSRGDFILTICAPQALEDKKSERMVSKRLKRHFLHRALRRKKESLRIRLRGFIFVICGICFLTFLTLAAYYKWFDDLAINIISIVVCQIIFFC